ncbi:MAG: glycosyltransferase family 2 protein [Ardenticatenaceae bacterium]
MLNTPNSPRHNPFGDPIVDVVIPTRGRGSLIDITITSIRQSTFKAFTLWVVDQSDDDATEEAVRPHTEADPRICYIRSPTRGSSIGRNIGAAAGSAPYVIFTDDDCRVELDWLQVLISELQQNEAWAVFGRIIPDEVYKDKIPPGAKPVTKGLPMALKDAPQHQVYEGNRFNLSFGHGANMGFRRKCYEQINGFDELLGAGGPLRSWPERDIGYRILLAGGRIVYTPHALVYHRHWRGWEDVRLTYRNYAFGAGAVVSKYLRCGDLGGLYLLIEWFLDQGVRQVLSGILKWRSSQKIHVGLLQLTYPWVGIAHSLRYPVDRAQMTYKHEGRRQVIDSTLKSEPTG